MVDAQASLSGEDRGNDGEIVVDEDSGREGILSEQIGAGRRLDELTGILRILSPTGAGIVRRPILEHLVHAIADHLALRPGPIETGTRLIAIFLVAGIGVVRQSRAASD